VKTLVIDASIAVKWVIEEDGTPDALTIRQRARMIAPELLVPECANILWKKIQRDELTSEQALFAARLLQIAEIELVPMRSLFEAAMRMAIELDHAAYDCLYLSLAIENKCQFVTADERLLRKLDRRKERKFREGAISLIEAAKQLNLKA
jgi:predicted nucleic acid-binding protein